MGAASAELSGTFDEDGKTSGADTPLQAKQALIQAMQSVA